MKILIALFVAMLLVTACSHADVATLQIHTANYKDYAAFTSPVRVVGIVKIKADQVDKFISIASPMSNTMRAQPGNISYSLEQSLSEPTEFMWIEEWKDGKSLGQHINSHAVADLVAKTRSMIQVPTRLFILEKK